MSSGSAAVEPLSPSNRAPCTRAGVRGRIAHKPASVCRRAASACVPRMASSTSTRNLCPDERDMPRYRTARHRVTPLCDEGCAVRSVGGFRADVVRSATWSCSRLGSDGWWRRSAKSCCRGDGSVSSPDRVVHRSMIKLNRRGHGTAEGQVISVSLKWCSGRGVVVIGGTAAPGIAVDGQRSWRPFSMTSKCRACSPRTGERRGVVRPLAASR